MTLNYIGRSLRTLTGTITKRVTIMVTKNFHTKAVSLKQETQVFGSQFAHACFVASNCALENESLFFL